MAGTYTQIYIHCVFAVQNRISLIKDDWKQSLYQYMNAIISAQGHKPFAINGMQDHVHLFISMNPARSLSDLVYHIKRSSSLWINNNGLVRGKFRWQEGFGAFSYSKSQIPIVIEYIKNQEKHHKKQSFIDEYVKFLEQFGIEYDKRYIFIPIDSGPMPGT